MSRILNIRSNWTAEFPLSEFLMVPLVEAKGQYELDFAA